MCRAQIPRYRTELLRLEKVTTRTVGSDGSPVYARHTKILGHIMRFVSDMAFADLATYGDRCSVATSAMRGVFNSSYTDASLLRHNVEKCAFAQQRFASREFLYVAARLPPQASLADCNIATQAGVVKQHREGRERMFKMLAE